MQGRPWRASGEMPLLPWGAQTHPPLKKGGLVCAPRGSSTRDSTGARERRSSCPLLLAGALGHVPHGLWPGIDRDGGGQRRRRRLHLHAGGRPVWLAFFWAAGCVSAPFVLCPG